MFQKEYIFLPLPSEIALCMEPKVYYRIHKSLSPVPILNQMTPVHTTPSFS
jgi:hypothetical protein